MCRIVEYYVIFIYFQAAVSALLAVSGLYVEKNQNNYYVIFDNSTQYTYQITVHLSSLGVPGMPWRHPQILADQLTLSQPGGAAYAHYIPIFSDLSTALNATENTYSIE